MPRSQKVLVATLADLVIFATVVVLVQAFGIAGVLAYFAFRAVVRGVNAAR